MNFSTHGDFELVADGLEAVTLTSRAGSASTLEKVLRQEIDRKEVWASNGFYKSGDSVFHLSTTEYQSEPELGATITTASAGIFTILTVVLDTLGDRWECVGRNLAVSESLSERITILQAGDLLRTSSGALRPSSWIEESRDVLARVQPMQAERIVAHDQAVFPETGICVLLYARDLDNTRRIQRADGTVWKILKVSKRERIDVLMEAEIERTPWPLS